MPPRRAAFRSTIAEFHSHSSDDILGKLGTAHTGDLTPAQRKAWTRQIEILRSSLFADSAGTICFEYVIPRIGKRADNLVLIGNTILVIEFKVNATQYERGDENQAVDYALDLKYFHEGCREVVIVPILVATQAPAKALDARVGPDGVCTIVRANAKSLGDAIGYSIGLGRGPEIDAASWLSAGYRPTPTIIEASQALYRGHAVDEITRCEAGADNLGATTVAISRIIDRARVAGKKAICLLTGVPGAGKTLAGLNLASERRKVDATSEEHAVFLSGNGPLVRVLQEALARDEVKRAKERNKPLGMETARTRAKSFIQNIHHFRDECLSNSAPPTERVVVFDEAQRAWDREQASKFMIQKRGMPHFNQSEPDFLIGAMDRHEGWAVIVCLIGSGQEINTGEAGVSEWLRALEDEYPHWSIHTPPYLAEEVRRSDRNPGNFGERLQVSPALHLGVSIRSFRSERLSEGVSHLLEGQARTAKEHLTAVRRSYTIYLTRDLKDAKTWVRNRARGSERYGLLASSGARRLKPLGILAGGIKGNECNWFLDNDQDVRSSYYLEDAASEFEVQGLELDWSIVVWDGDLVYGDQGWLFRTFKGTKWQIIRNKDDQRYRLNAYRVLLTRARQGLIIVVPEGDPMDETRLPAFYDPTWEYLNSLDLQSPREGSTS